MIIGRRRLVALAGTFALAPAVSRVAFAQAWPTRPVRIVVPYAPGGSTDTVARITADRLSSIWGQQLVIENKPGAGTNIGAAAVASSDPDGYTMAHLPLQPAVFFIIRCLTPSAILHRLR